MKQSIQRGNSLWFYEYNERNCTPIVERLFEGRVIDLGTENTNWGQSVAGVAIKDNKVLLARHTYGNGKGMLIIPGGYVNYGETPQQALKREYMEETKIEVEHRI